MNIFEFDSYVDGVRAFLKMHSGQIGIKTEFANACGCRLSYLSQVLAETAHMTLDHAFGAAKFMQLDQNGVDYFILLVQSARAADPSYRHYLQGRLNLIRAKSSQVSSQISASTKLSNEEMQLYYSDHLYQQIHILLTIPGLQRFDNLRDHLALSAPRLRSLLTDLQKMGLAEPTKDLWKARNRDMHVPIESPLAIQRHLQWKMRAIADMQSRDTSSTHYEATFSLSAKDFEKVKALLVSFIKSSRDIALKSAEEQAAHLDLSMFRI
ncbi:MAG: DUF4423 domain-containing protein [Proteobacteria bacterium]|nr:MAG: DUF4423 domain-containing protein [Pseudomonadota bacterium]